MKILVTILIGTLLILGIGSSAGAYPPGGVVLAASSTQVSPGESFTVTLTGCSPGETVVFAISGSTDEATCDEMGNATGTLTAPTTPGTYTVAAEGMTSGVVARIEITVIGEDAEPPPADGDEPAAPPVDGGSVSGALPATGSSSATPVMQMAGISLLAGLGLVTVAYRRRLASR